MLYRQFGKTGEKVSILGFGCMRFPIIDQDTTKIDEEKAIEMMHFAIDRGLNYVDTAYPYHGLGGKEGGMSEPLVAKALKNGYREKVYLATKLPSWLVETRQDMDMYLNRQLERLETSYIDFYLVHALDEARWKKMLELGIIDFLESALKDGRIRYAGFSFHDKLETFKQIVDDYDWSFCQIQYNYIDEEYQAGKEGLDYAVAKNLGIVIMEPLRGGNLVRSIPEAVQEVFDEAKEKKTPAKWALKWIWEQPETHVVLSGMSTLDQVKENMDIASTSYPHAFTDQEKSIMNRAKKIFRDRIQVDCTGCEYCMPCPYGVNIPRNFGLYNEYNLFDSKAIKDNQKEQYQHLDDEQKASACVACGTCISKCPQNIAIPDKLSDVAKTLKA